MPLQHGTSRAVIGNNISEMEEAGHPKNQAIAAALSTARRSGAKIPKKRADGGGIGRALPLTGPPGSGAAEHVYAGPLHTHVPGRTDKINLNVKPGSYVVPADVVSAMGEGNTLAGSAVLQMMFGPKALTGSVPAPEGKPNLMERRMERHDMLPGKPPSMGLPHMKGEEYGSGFADGGRTDGAIPVVVAGGEHIIDPDQIKHKFRHAKEPLAAGHAALDHMVGEVRRRDIKWKSKAPPPKK